MHISTEALITKAIDTNSEIQEDNLIMLNMCNALCDTARTIKAFEALDKVASKGDFDATTFDALDFAMGFTHKLKLNKGKCLKLSKEDRRAVIHNSIEKFVNKNKKHISDSLINMVETSITDLFDKTDFDKATKFPKKKIFIYSKEAIDSIANSFHTLVQNLSFTNNTKYSFTTIMNKFAKEFGEHMAFVHTKIGYEGFVSIDVPQPKIQTMADASIRSINDINNIGTMLNSITYKEMRERIAQIKTNITNRINQSTNTEDTVKSIHFVAQMLMSIKNSVILMKNYHKAALNEINK